MLTDTGPLVALLNRNDPNHAKCVAAAKSLPGRPLVTTWPCFTEAMYLLFRGSGNLGQQALWQLVMTGRLLLHDLNSADMPFMAESMKNYRDRPMDLADASLVCAASHLGTRIVFTLDSDFLVYRLPDGRSFEPVLFP